MMSHVIHRFKMIVCPYPILVKNGTVLLTRRKNTPYMPGMYSLPAGHEEADESMIACLLREVKEEVGIAIDPSVPVLSHVMHRKEEDVRMDLFFLVTAWRGTPRICESDKCDGIGWYTWDKLPDNTVPYIRAGIQYVRRGVFYSQEGW